MKARNGRPVLRIKVVLGEDVGGSEPKKLEAPGKPVVRGGSDHRAGLDITNGAAIVFLARNSTANLPSLFLDGR